MSCARKTWYWRSYSPFRIRLEVQESDVPNTDTGMPRSPQCSSRRVPIFPRKWFLCTGKNPDNSTPFTTLKILVERNQGALGRAHGKKFVRHRGKRGAHPMLVEDSLGKLARLEPSAHTQSQRMEQESHLLDNLYSPLSARSENLYEPFKAGPRPYLQPYEDKKESQYATPMLSSQSEAFHMEKKLICRPKVSQSPSVKGSPQNRPLPSSVAGRHTH
jgi:hypothetical protein